jgi:hypothetical protein
MSNPVCFRVFIKDLALRYDGADQSMKRNEMLLKLDWAHRFRTFQTQVAKHKWDWSSDTFHFEYKTKFPESLHLQKLSFKVVQVGWIFNTVIAHSFIDLRSLASGNNSHTLPCYAHGGKKPIPGLQVSFSCEMMQWYPLVRLISSDLSISLNNAADIRSVLHHRATVWSLELRVWEEANKSVCSHLTNAASTSWRAAFSQSHDDHASEEQLVVKWSEYHFDIRGASLVDLKKSVVVVSVVNAACQFECTDSISLWSLISDDQKPRSCRLGGLTQTIDATFPRLTLNLGQPVFDQNQVNHEDKQDWAHRFQRLKETLEKNTQIYPDSDLQYLD